MREMKRLRLAALCAGLLAVVAVASPGLAAGAGQCPSAQAWAWVKAHQGPLPTDARELALYPVAQRMAIVASLDPENRSRLWREHFDRHLNQDASLTSLQRVVLEDAKTLFSPALFSEQAGKSLLEHDLPRLLERAIDAFGQEKGIALLTVIDPSPSPTPEPTPTCSCGTGPADTCGKNRFCDDTATCTPTRLGCGAGGAYACNGQCANNAPVPDPTPVESSNLP